MKYLLEKDKKRRKLVSKYEFKRSALKSMLYNCNFPITFRWKAGFELSKLPRDSSRLRLKNRCTLTTRGKGVSRAFKISRIELRVLSNAGKISGLTKSS